MIPFSILDLAPVPSGSTISDSFANSKALAQQADALGYHRYWLAEHHNMPGIASAATSLLISHLAAATSRIRLGCRWHYAAESLTFSDRRTIWHFSHLVPKPD